MYKMIMKKYNYSYIAFVILFLFLFYPAGSLTVAHAEEESRTFQYPNDPYNDALWSYENTGFYTHYYGTFPISQSSTYGIDMNIWDAWAQYPLTKEETRTVIVAVIDTGIDYRHPDLADQMWINPGEIPDNGMDDDGNGYIDDIYGWDFYNNDNSVCHYVETSAGYSADPDDNDNHGTHIAGIIAATSNNSIGISGVASNVNIKIMSIKIHGGSTSSGSVTNAIKAIRYAEQMGADICNLSWGTTNYNQDLELAIRESSMLFITAAGNNGNNNNSTPMFPAGLRLPNLISVAYIDSDGELAKDSNYGVSTVDIAAPGQNIYSTLVGSYGYSSGSSMAAPHVTGLAAMIYAYQENIYPSQVKELLLHTLLPLDSLDGYLIHPGIPDAGMAIQCLSQLQADSDTPFLVLESSFRQETISIQADAYDAGGSGIRKLRYAYGSKTADYFVIHGNGTSVLDNNVLVTKPGYYTFYVEDHAGNYNLYTYYVKEDTTAPDYTISYKVAPDYSEIKVSFSAFDSDSGVKSIKYLLGEFDSSDFLFAGEPLDPASGQHSIFIAPDTAAVSFYITDYRGNSTVCVMYPSIVPATALYLNITERSLFLLETFQLQPLIFPWLSTDGVTYHSLNDSVVFVDSQGTVTAIGEGEALVQVTTYSGVSAMCRFLVQAANSTEALLLFDEEAE